MSWFDYEIDLFSKTLIGIRNAQNFFIIWYETHFPFQKKVIIHLSKWTNNIKDSYIFWKEKEKGKINKHVFNPTYVLN